MYGKKRYYSREYLGIKLVPLTSRVRKAVKIVDAQYTVALLPNGKVAVKCDTVFEEKFERATWTQDALVSSLHALGMISKTQMMDVINKHRNDKRLDKARSAARSFEQAAKDLGINITSQQALQISRAIKD